MNLDISSPPSDISEDSHSAVSDIIGKILPRQSIAQLMEQRHIFADDEIPQAHIQPASLDLRLGYRAYRVRASFLPGIMRVMDRCAELTYHEIDLTQEAVLETGCVYLIELMEQLALPPDILALANPKSSTGRIDVFTRLISDYSNAFDRIASGYAGRLYLEVCPQTFPILVRPGSKLAQIRFKQVVPNMRPQNYSKMLSLSLHAQESALLGYRAVRHGGVIDVDKVDALEIADYWQAIHKLSGDQLVLEPNEFYILASREEIVVPPSYAAELMPFNAYVGEFRVHYAGFFDPGFGVRTGARAVLEIRSHDVPFIMMHGQPIGKLIYEPLSEATDQPYGCAQAHYQGQNLRLSKHFRQN